MHNAETTQQSPGTFTNELELLVMAVNKNRQKKLELERERKLVPAGPHLFQYTRTERSMKRRPSKNDFRLSWEATTKEPGFSLDGLRNALPGKSDKSGNEKWGILVRLGELIDLVKLFIALPDAHTNCKFYGHVIDHATWTRHCPRCAECGVRIQNHTQLKRALPSV